MSSLPSPSSLSSQTGHQGLLDNYEIVSLPELFEMAEVDVWTYVDRECGGMEAFLHDLCEGSA